MKKKYLLFDLSEELLNRYPAWIGRNFGEYVNFDEVSMDDDSFFWRLSKKQFIDSYDGVFIFGHRLPDLIIACLFKNQGKKVFYVQHGIFKERLERDLFTFINVLKIKGFDYFRCYLLGVRSKNIHTGLWGFFLLIAAALYSNRYVGLFVQRYFTEKIDGALVFSDSDVDEFKKIFSDQIGKYAVIGAPDAARFDSGCDENLALIFAQTLVEDGRLSLKKYREALSLLMYRLKDDGYTPKIFLHHRSNVDIYLSFCQSEDIVTNCWEIPSAFIYLSDYSSLLLTAEKLGFRVSRFNISGHKLPFGFEGIPVYPKYKEKIVKINSDVKESDVYSELIKEIC